MSDNILKIIPSAVGFMPPRDLVDRALESLRQVFPDADEIKARTSDDILFIDQGTNWERVSCPNCGKQIDIAWWQAAMDRAHKGRFLDLEVVMPCCGAKSSLNLLKYEWPAGFARFVLEIRNPGSDIDNGTKKSLETLLNMALRTIWARY